MMAVSSYICFVIFYLTQWRSSAEMFTSMSALAPLLETHSTMVDTLDAIIHHEEKMLDFLKRQHKIYKVEQVMAMNDTNNYLENPINAFTLIKRLTIDKVLMKYIIKSKTDKLTKELSEKYSDAIYPGADDLEGAAQALVRLKDTYRLSVSDLSKGLLNGVSYGSPMRSSDCFELGRVLFRLGQYQDALPWMMEAYYMHDEDDSLLNDKIAIVEYIVYIQFLIGDLDDATEWMNILRDIDPERSRRKNNISDLRRAIEKREIKHRSILEGNFPEDDDVLNEEVKNNEMIETFDSLCRGDVTVPKEISNKLSCRYLTDTHPFLKIAPFKVEQVHLNPEILIYYDVLMDDEIDAIINTAKPNMERARVSSSRLVTDYRIGKVAWLDVEESEVVARVSRRVNQMTGLNMETAEMLQVVNYGIGGHYWPHLDVDRGTGDSEDYNYPGDRMNTLLFYMSDVAEGGSTVFTKLGFGVSPKKGMAILWYNLHHSGAADLAAEHGSCPVLLGSKWISICQLHEGGQEFIRPCNLEYQPEGREDLYD